MKKIALIIVTSFLIFSCKENNSTESIKPQGSEVILVPSTAKEASFSNLRTPEVNSDVSAEEFAKLLASTLKDKDLRKFLKDEANKKFDGDFDILFAEKVNIKIGESKFSDKLKSNSKNGNEIINNILSNPLFNISIPLLIEKWNETNQIPLVAVATNVEEKVTKSIKAYDKNGKTYLIEVEKEPNVPVIIIGINERVKFNNGKYENKYSKIKTITEKHSKLLACSYPFRQNNSYEVLRGMKFSKLSDYEAWTKGSPEMAIWVVAPTSPNNFVSANSMYEAHFEGPNRNQIDGVFWNESIPLFYWNSPEKANTMLYQFNEEDTGNSYTVSLGLGIGFTTGISTPGTSSTSTSGTVKTPTIGFSATFKDGDDLIGKTTLEQFICPYNGDNSYQIGNAFYFKTSN